MNSARVNAGNFKYNGMSRQPRAADVSESIVPPIVKKLPIKRSAQYMAISFCLLDSDANNSKPFTLTIDTPKRTVEDKCQYTLTNTLNDELICKFSKSNL